MDDEPDDPTTIENDETNVVQLPTTDNNKGRFSKDGGRENPGRRVGAINKNTRILKEAIMLAAELEGGDGQGSGKLVGYLRRVARDDMRAFVSLLGRVIPLQVEARTVESKDERVVYKTVEEVQRELLSRGINMDVMIRMSKMLKGEDIIGAKAD